MRGFLKIGRYFEKRYEVSFWVNVLMCATFIITKQYLFAGMTLALAVVQFQPRIFVDKVPYDWQQRIKQFVIRTAYVFGPKSYLVSINGVMKVVRLKKRDDDTLFICRCKDGYKMAMAETNRFSKTTEEAVHLLSSIYYKELMELRGQLEREPELNNE